MVKYRVKELAISIDGEIIGDEELEIEGVGGADNVKDNEITFASNEEFFGIAQKAAAIIVNKKLAQKKSSNTLIVVANPRLAFAKVAKKFMPQPYYKPGISKQAQISKEAKLGSNLSIHHGVVVEKGAKIGDNVTLAPGVYVGHDVEIGEDSLIYPNAVLEYDTKLGARVKVLSGSVVGSQGYGFEEGDDGHIKVPQFGNVVIGDDVEIGANVTIDRAATGSTVVGCGTKIDNLVHIAHNVEIGENSLIIAQVGIAGSAKIGNNVTLAGKSGVVGHLTVGDNVTLGAYSAITHDIAANSFVSGYPAHNHRQERRIKAARKKLPDMLKKIRRLEKRISELEEKLAKGE